MTRLRILELPHRPGDEPPFVVVIDDTGDGETAERLRDDFDGTFPVAAEQLGARYVLVFTDPIDLPGDDRAPNPHTPDVAAAAREQLDKARSWARHGYEIGQRHCGWSDHGVAPAWLTEGWPPHIEACEHTARAAEYDTALARVRGLAEHPESVDALTSDPAGYARGYRDAIRDAKRAARVERGEASS